MSRCDGLNNHYGIEFKYFCIFGMTDIELIVLDCSYPNEFKCFGWLLYNCIYLNFFMLLYFFSAGHIVHEFALGMLVENRKSGSISLATRFRI